MKTVLVTGSCRGLGAKIITKFAMNGYNVIINYKKSIDCAENLRNFIQNTYKVKTYVYKCDVSKEDEVIDLFDSINTEIGNIDVIVNNAGMCIDNEIDNKTGNEFMNVIENNLLSTFLVCKYGSKLIKKGSIINVSSNNIYNGSYIESIDYDASKMGIVSLTNNFAKYLAPNIRVNAIAPGWIETDMIKDINPDFKNKEEEKILLGRFANADEIADGVYFLANNTYVNNIVLRIDGGIK